MILVVLWQNFELSQNNYGLYRLLRIPNKNYTNQVIKSHNHKKLKYQCTTNPSSNHSAQWCRHLAITKANLMSKIAITVSNSSQHISNTRVGLNLHLKTQRRRRESILSIDLDPIHLKYNFFQKRMKKKQKKPQILYQSKNIQNREFIN